MLGQALTGLEVWWAKTGLQKPFGGLSALCPIPLHTSKGFSNVLFPRGPSRGFRDEVQTLPNLFVPPLLPFSPPLCPDLKFQVPLLSQEPFPLNNSTPLRSLGGQLPLKTQLWTRGGRVSVCSALLASCAFALTTLIY